MTRSTQHVTLRLDRCFSPAAPLCARDRRLPAGRDGHPVLHRRLAEEDDELGRLGQLRQDLQRDASPTVIVRTFVWTFFSVGLKMIIGTFGAVLLNAAVPGRRLFRILIMPPWIVPMAIGIFMWGWMYNGQFGMISGAPAELRHRRAARSPSSPTAAPPSGRRSSPTSGSACRW